ncbi:MAG: DUF512 domain-containing protein [Candidatus Zixiibacteriota bacterium]
MSDELDFHFCNTEETLVLDIESGGKTQSFELDGFADPGLEFEQMKIRVCKNKCLFCFVHQQPKGMRRSLYIKDDDYRFSFTHGNFITLSDMTDADFGRIIEQRLSPMYISVHATDDTLRRCLFQNERLEPVMPRLRQMTENGITIHAQSVVCPDVNDGEHLKKTIEDLAGLAPGVESLAIVPVGLTRYRERLPKLRPFTSDESQKVLDLVEGYQKRFLADIGTRFVFPADEFFINAGREFPSLSYYEEMPQFENGVGMARQFIVDFNRKKRILPKSISRRAKMALITGISAEGILQKYIVPRLNEIRNLSVDAIAVPNIFWGETVTVSGLLTGQDILNAVQKSDADVIVLPPNCLNGDDLFLDNVSLTQFTERAGRPVITGSYDIAGLIQTVCRKEVA